MLGFFALENSLKNECSPIGSGQVRVAFHPKGCCASVAFNTDTFAINRARTLMWMYRHNFKFTYMDIDDTGTDRHDYYDTTMVDFGIYVNETAKNQLQSDPPVFTELQNEIDAITNVQNGKVPTVVSYRGGEDDYAEIIKPYFLGGRNSRSANNGNPTNLISSTAYKNISADDLMSRPSTNRPNYYSQMTQGDFIDGTEAEGLIDYNSKIVNILKTNGYYSGFAHIHWTEVGYYERYLEQLRTSIGSARVYNGFYTDLAEYYFVKSSVSSISRSGLVVTIDYAKDDATRPYENIGNKLWFEFNAVGTALEDLPIQTDVSSEIIKLTDNYFVIGIDIDYTLTTVDVTFSEAVDETGYNDETIPVVSVNTGTGAITSDQPIRYTLFRKLIADDEWDVSDEFEYEHTLSASHTISGSIDTGTYDYYLGYVNEYGQSGLYEF